MQFPGELALRLDIPIPKAIPFSYYLSNFGSSYGKGYRGCPYN